MKIITKIIIGVVIILVLSIGSLIIYVKYYGNQLSTKLETKDIQNIGDITTTPPETPNI